MSFSKPALKEKNYSVHSHAPRAPFPFDPQENLACVYLILASASDSAPFSSTEQLEKVMRLDSKDSKNEIPPLC